MTSSKENLNYSWWFSFILFLLIWPMFVGPLIAFINPPFYGETELNLGTSLFIARNIAVGLAFLLSIYLKNASMLFILIVVRLITDLIDAPLFYIFREPNLIGQIIIFTFLCYLPAIFGLRYLWQKINHK